jgi:methionine-rich copper-binding protein CopC
LFRLLLLALLLLPGVAGAHAILLDSQPAARGVAAPGPARITLRFNSRVDHGRSRLALRTGGRERVLVMSPAGADDVLEAQADLVPGEYVLRWQVLAVDGHITRGEVPFHVGALQALVPDAPPSQAQTSQVRAPQTPAPQTPAPQTPAAQAKAP